MARDDRIFAIVLSSLILAAAVGITVQQLAQRVGAPAIASAKPAASGSGRMDVAKPTQNTSAPQRSAAVDSGSRQEAGSAARPAVDSASSPAVSADLSELARFVEALAALADGSSLPARSEVLVREDGDGRMVVAAGTQRRYQELVESITALDWSECARALRTSADGRAAVGVALSSNEPTLEGQVRQVVGSLLEVELPMVEPSMVAGARSWLFADAGYESMSPAQQHLLLMGRAQAGQLQSGLEKLRAAMGWTVPEPDKTSDDFLKAEQVASVTGDESSPAAVADLDQAITTSN